MKTKAFLTLALLPVIALSLAACGSDDNSSDTTASTSGSSSTASQPFTTKTVPNVGEILVDSSGNALYFNDQDTTGDVKCTGECAAIWVPLVQDGKPVGLDGKPLYTFTEDTGGKVTGDGFRDSFAGVEFTWTVARPSGAAAAAPAATTSTDETTSTEDDSSGSSGGGGAYGY